MLIDSHVHFDVYREDGSLADVVRRAREAGVHRMVSVGGASESNALALDVSLKYRGALVPVIGYNRDLASSLAADERTLGNTMLALREALARSRNLGSPAVAVGEIGLDFHHEPETGRLQELLFERQLGFARDEGLPVVVHSREAQDATLSLLAEHAAHRPGSAGPVGVLHCFTGTHEFAHRLLDLGFFISFSGIVTFQNAEALRDVVRLIPSDRILVETDSPYLAPVPKRGKRNEPAFVQYVAAALAEIRGVSPDEMAEQTSRNAEQLFGLNR